MTRKIKDRNIAKVKFLYLVEPHEEHENMYVVSKCDPNTRAVLDSYQVTIRGNIENEKEIWCNCPGFRMQQYNKALHKHVL